MIKPAPVVETETMYIPFVCQIDPVDDRIVEYRPATDRATYSDRQRAWSEAIAPLRRAGSRPVGTTEPRIATVVDGEIVAIGIGGDAYTDTSGEENLTEIADGLGYPLHETIKPRETSLEDEVARLRAKIAYIVEYCRDHQSVWEWGVHCNDERATSRETEWALHSDINPEDIIEIIFGTCKWRYEETP